MGTFTPYIAPVWCKSLGKFPIHKIKLCNRNTPIHKWRLPNVGKEFNISIKRDDMTGSTLSGNKVRKLEFLFADAIQKGCKHIITSGGIQSNHCRTTAVAAAQLGLKCHLIMRSTSLNPADTPYCGNMLLDRMCGASVYLVDRLTQEESGLIPRGLALARYIKEKLNEDSYVIPVGGSNSVGLFGYISAFEELLNQGVDQDFDDIVAACGSGGTVCGLAIANYLSGNKLRIHAITVCDNKRYFHEHINNTLSEVQLNDVKSEDIVDIIDGYKGNGYGLSTQEELDYITEVSLKTGIFLDPTYTGKAAYGLMQELKNNPERFKGKRILFIHTGGLFGLYDGRIDDTLESKNETNNVVNFDDLGLKWS